MEIDRHTGRMSWGEWVVLHKSRSYQKLRERRGANLHLVLHRERALPTPGLGTPGKRHAPVLATVCGAA